MILGRHLPHLFFLLILVPVLAVAESSSVARMLGVKSAAVASAVEDGAKRTPYGQDDLRDKMEVETSKFLSRSQVRSPVSYDPEEAAKYQRPADRLKRGVAERRTALKNRQEQALEMLEFRRDVEDAMGKILSFQPTVERAEPGWQPEPGPTPSVEDGWEYRSARDPRQRLMATVETRDMGYAPRPRRPRQDLRAPQYREPALQQTLLYNQRARGTEPQAQRRKIRVINDESRHSQRTAGGVVRLGR